VTRPSKACGSAADDKQVTHVSSNRGDSSNKGRHSFGRSLHALLLLYTAHIPIPIHDGTRLMTAPLKPSLHGSKGSSSPCVHHCRYVSVHAPSPAVLHGTSAAACKAHTWRPQCVASGCACTKRTPAVLCQHDTSARHVSTTRQHDTSALHVSTTRQHDTSAPHSSTRPIGCKAVHQPTRAHTTVEGPVPVSTTAARLAAPCLSFLKVDCRQDCRVMRHASGTAG
jgi:hypothetical protein